MAFFDETFTFPEQPSVRKPLIRITIKPNSFLHESEKCYRPHLDHRLCRRSPRLSGCPEKELTQSLSSKVTEVTVYADRARVTRESVVDLPPELKRVSFSKLPSWIDEGSVRVSLRLEGAAKGEVLDVQVRRTYLTAASDEEVRKAQEAVQEIADKMTELSDRQKIIDQRRKHLESIRVFSLEKLPKDAASREVKVEEYSAFLTFLEGSSKLNEDRGFWKRRRKSTRTERPPEKA